MTRLLVVSAIVMCSADAALSPCETAGRSLVADCNRTIRVLETGSLAPGSAETCPPSCMAAHERLATEMKESGVQKSTEDGTQPLCKVVANGDRHWNWEAWRFYAQLDVAVGNQSNPCSFPADSTCAKSFMMASYYAHIRGCQNTCSTTCQQLVQSFFANCPPDKSYELLPVQSNAPSNPPSSAPSDLPFRYILEDGVAPMKRSTLAVMVALTNDCVDFMGSDPLGQPYCAHDRLVDALCSLLSASNFGALYVRSNVHQHVDRIYNWSLVG